MLSGMSPHELIPSLCAIAAGAGDIIVASSANPVYKADGSPVTEADRAAEAYITEKLAALAPRVPVIGEESTAGADSLRALEAGKPCWLVDPLDGTKEFLKGSGEFTVNIALVEEGLPVLGVVYAPVKESLYAGTPEGSYKITGVHREPLPLYEAPQDRIRLVTSRSHLSEEDSVLPPQLKALPVERLYAGSSLKFCMVAERTADLYLRRGRTMYWDTAAGHAVLKGAGGLLLNLETGRELDYRRLSLENPAFIATWRDLLY